MQRSREPRQERDLGEPEAFTAASHSDGRRFLRRSFLGAGVVLGLLALTRSLSERLGLGGSRVPAHAPLSTRVLRTSDISFEDRSRLDVRALVEPSRDRPAIAATLASLTKSALEDHPGVAVVLLFAYRSEEEAQGGFTVGRAEASRDGKGWDGHGHVSGPAQLNDRGRIEVEVVKHLNPTGDRLPPLETVRYAFSL